MMSRIAWLLVLLITMAACASAREKNAPTGAVNSPMKSTGQPSIRDSFITSLPVSRLTKLPTETKAAPATDTPTPEPTLVKLSREEVIAEVEARLEADDSCGLPCWWGITPGETTLAETRALIAPLVSSSCCGENDWVPDQVTEIRLPLAEQHSVQGMISMMFYFQEDIVRTIQVEELKWPYYSIGEVLEDYGIPNEIWVHTIPNFPGSNPPLSLFLFYRDKGILLYYYSLDHEVVSVNGTVVRGCFSTSPALYLWSPKEDLSIKQVGKLFVQTKITDQGDPILPFRDVSTYSVSDFYTLYRGRTDQAVCLDITLPDTDSR